MTTQEAIERLHDLQTIEELDLSTFIGVWYKGIKDDYDEALDMAIEALNIDIVRCKDCIYQSKGENVSESWNLCGFRPWLYIPTSDDHFCGYGERGEADDSF